MASLVAPCRSQLLHPANILLLVTIIIASTIAAVGSTADTPPKPIEIYPSCEKTLMPKRCSATLSALSKSLAEAAQVLTSFQFEMAGGDEYKDPCVKECIKVAIEAASYATAAEKGGEDALLRLKEYLHQLLVKNVGPVAPCACPCPGRGGQCGSADQASGEQKMENALSAMKAMEDLFQLFSDNDSGKKGKRTPKESVASMEKSVDSGVLHFACGFTKEPEKCAYQLSALAKTMRKASRFVVASNLTKTKVSLAITRCTDAMTDIQGRLELAAALGQSNSLMEIRGFIHSDVQSGDCEYSCPPPPEKPCSDDEALAVQKLNDVHEAWVAADKFLAELLGLSPN